MPTQFAIERRTTKTPSRPTRTRPTPQLPPQQAPSILTRSPRTSLIDAEWEWLARRANATPLHDRDSIGQCRELAFAEEHTKTLPPPPFEKADTLAHDADAELADVSQAPKSVAPRPMLDGLAQAQGTNIGYMVRVLLPTALASFAIGIALLHGAANLVERDRAPTAAIAPTTVANAAVTDAASLPVQAPRAAPEVPHHELVVTNPPAPARPKANRTHQRSTAVRPAAVKRSAARPRIPSDNPY